MKTGTKIALGVAAVIVGGYLLVLLLLMGGFVYIASEVDKAFSPPPPLTSEQQRNGNAAAEKIRQELPAKFNPSIELESRWDEDPALELSLELNAQFDQAPVMDSLTHANAALEKHTPPQWESTLTSIKVLNSEKPIWFFEPEAAVVEKSLPAMIAFDRAGVPTSLRSENRAVDVQPWFRDSGGHSKQQCLERVHELRQAFQAMDSHLSKVFFNIDMRDCFDSGEGSYHPDIKILSTQETAEKQLQDYSELIQVLSVTKFEQMLICPDGSLLIDTYSELTPTELEPMWPGGAVIKQGFYGSPFQSCGLRDPQ